MASLPSAAAAADGTAPVVIKLKYGLQATYDDDFIYIDGATFPNKDRLKALGAKWVPDLKTWMCGADTDLSSLQLPASVSGVVGGAGAAAAAALAEPPALRKKITLIRKLPREELNFGLKAILSPDSVFIKGLTYENRERLTALGGRWDDFEKAYVFPTGFDLTPLRVPAGVKPTSIPVPSPKPWWFCGHENARIVNMARMSHTCPDCPSSNPFYSDFYVRGALYSGT
jgi:hypothetical protein